MNNFIKTYWHSDSIAPRVDLSFDTLSDCILYIENFQQDKPSEGLVWQNDEPILVYIVDRFGFITWKPWSAGWRKQE